MSTVLENINPFVELTASAASAADSVSLRMTAEQAYLLLLTVINSDEYANPKEKCEDINKILDRARDQEPPENSIPPWTIINFGRGDYDSALLWAIRTVKSIEDVEVVNLLLDRGGNLGIIQSITLITILKEADNNKDFSPTSDAILRTLIRNGYQLSDYYSTYASTSPDAEEVSGIKYNVPNTLEEIGKIIETTHTAETIMTKGVNIFYSFLIQQVTGVRDLVGEHLRPVSINRTEILANMPNHTIDIDNTDPKLLSLFSEIQPSQAKTLIRTATGAFQTSSFSSWKGYVFPIPAVFRLALLSSATNDINEYDVQENEKLEPETDDVNWVAPAADYRWGIHPREYPAYCALTTNCRANKLLQKYFIAIAGDYTLRMSATAVSAVSTAEASSALAKRFASAAVAATVAASTAAPSTAAAATVTTAANIAAATVNTATASTAVAASVIANTSANMPSSAVTTTSKP